jgi:hypothetical protein
LNYCPFVFSKKLKIFSLSTLLCVCGTRVWTQRLHLEPFHQPIFVMVLFQDRVSQAICSGWLQTLILLISAPE